MTDKLNTFLLLFAYKSQHYVKQLSTTTTAVSYGKLLNDEKIHVNLFPLLREIRNNFLSAAKLNCRIHHRKTIHTHIYFDGIPICKHSNKTRKNL